MLETADTSDPDMVGTHEIKMVQKIRYGSSTASQWIVITINCLIKNLTASPRDIVNSVNNQMKEVEYVIGDPKLKVDFSGFKQGKDCKLRTTYKFTL